MDAARRGTAVLRTGGAYTHMLHEHTIIRDYTRVRRAAEREHEHGHEHEGGALGSVTESRSNARRRPWTRLSTDAMQLQLRSLLFFASLRTRSSSSIIYCAYYI